MNIFYTLSPKNALSRALLLLFVGVFSNLASRAQMTLSPSSTAAALAATLTGPGVIVLSPVLNCNDSANAIFTTGAVDPVGVSNGIVLASGKTSESSLAQPATFFESASFTPSLADADLATLSGGTTFDACVLEFDFKAAGDTVKFDYVFGSEEYPEFACSIFNDVFGFLISGGVTSPLTSYPTPYNIARIPGTTIPVCINSVNSAPVGTGYAIATCNALGPGSPFGMYYINNSASTMLAYDGKTTVLRAMAAVSPCDTYHLKLGIADVGDPAYNSGVFIKGGSLTSTVPTTISSAGTNGLPYCIRGCAPGKFVFSTPVPQDTALIVHYTIAGTAVNGYDYATLPGYVVFPILAPSVTVDVTPYLVPAAGPKTVIIQIYRQNPCIPGDSSLAAEASLTILDSFNFHIITPDTAVCAGQYVNIIAIGDTLFDTVLSYVWTPPPTLSSTNTLLTTATPMSTTTYSLTAIADAALGCIPQTKTITISMYPNPVLTIDSALIKTCVGVSEPMNVYVSPPGTPYTYTWSPGTALSSTNTSSTIVTPTIPGDVTYTVTVYPTALPLCFSTANITVHTLPNDFTLHNQDTAICIGESVQVDITGPSEFIWRWIPPTFVSNPDIMEPSITPTVNSSYTVTANYAHCPEMAHGFYIEVDTPATQVTIFDTICIPMSYTIDLTVPGSTGIGNGYYHYQWTPATYVSNDTIPNPVITPAIGGLHVYTVTIQPHAASCAVDDIINLYVLPNTINLVTPDTAICRGKSVQIVATGDDLFSYQWLPTTGIPMSTLINPMITPDTSALYKVKVSFHLCPDFYDSVFIDVQPIPNVYIGGHRFVCQHDTIRIVGNVSPGWYDHYIYSWSPATYLNVTTDRSVYFSGVTPATNMVILNVTTPAGCTGGDSAQIIVLPGDFASMQTDYTFCPHDSVVLKPTGGVSYEWFPSTYLNDDKSATPILKPITSESYSVIATSEFGCKDTLYFNAKVFPAAVIYLTDSVRLHPGETYQIEPETNCTIFTWTPSGGLSGKYIANPLASPEMSTKYIVYGTTELGCKTKDSINIIIDNETLLDLPNAFAPGSGSNREFKIIKRGIATLNYFRIFNRWGNLIFETTDINKGWNGEYNGIPQPVGVFVYDVQAVTSTGKIFRKQGNVTLLR